ncbi:MAG: ABC transporter [Alphaproteobacteria bacterium]|nr:ABC transporter [Alphaproteobacteria bacterium]
MSGTSTHGHDTSIVERRNPPFSPRRIGAMVLRYVYLIRGSWPRIIELAYWPTMQMILWGFITLFLMGHSNFIAQAFGILLSGVLLWDVLFRGQLGVAMSFLEEMWSRNLGHLFVSPLRPHEMLVSLMVVSFIRTLIGLIPASLLAMMLFGFSLYSLGLPLIGFFFNLIVMGWSIGFMVSGLILRAGLGAESMAWAMIFAIAPICGIYYPIDVLPGWLQSVAFFLPASHVFEGMRAILVDGAFRPDLMFNAVLLNIGYLALGMFVFLTFFRSARVQGMILQVGE